MVIDPPAVCALQQGDGLAVAIPRHLPQKRAGPSSIDVWGVEVVLAMASVLRAQVGAMIYERNGLTSEDHCAALSAQCLHIAPRYIERIRQGKPE